MSPETSSRTLVFIHGYALDAPDWEQVAWADPFAGQLGRIPAGLDEAIRLGAGAVMFGSAAVSADGRVEAEFSAEWAQAHVVELVSVLAGPGKDARLLRGRLENLLERDFLMTKHATDTRAEVREAADKAGELGYDRLVLVSSPNHLPRCLRDALDLASEPGRGWLRRTLAVRASDTCYSSGSTASVCVLDLAPVADPLRADALARRTGALLSRYPESEHPGYLDHWEAYLDDWESRG